VDELDRRIRDDIIRTDIVRYRRLWLLSAFAVYGAAALGIALSVFLDPNSIWSDAILASLFLGSVVWGYLFTLPLAFYGKSKGSFYPPIGLFDEHVKFYVMRCIVAPISLTLVIVQAVREPKRCRSCLAENPRKRTECTECSAPI
jgi:hypothetical protein